MDFDIEVPKRETSSDATPFALCSEDTTLYGTLN